MESFGVLILHEEAWRIDTQLYEFGGVLANHSSCENGWYRNDNQTVSGQIEQNIQWSACYHEDGCFHSSRDLLHRVTFVLVPSLLSQCFGRRFRDNDPPFWRRAAKTMPEPCPWRTASFEYLLFSFLLYFQQL